MSRILILALLGLLVSSLPCNQGQLLLNGGCVPCHYIPGCAKYAPDGSCDFCQYGYQRIDGKCSYLEEDKHNCCAVFGADGSCEQCAPGLVLDGNSCFRIERPGCLEGAGQKCDNCATGYENVGGKCFRQIPDCHSYSLSGACSKCELGFELIAGLCSEISYLKEVPDCEVQNEYGCVKCDSGFYLSKQKTCLRYKVGCLKYFREKCQLCEPAFVLVNGACQIEGCTEYGSLGCKTCSPAYQLDQGRCIIENCAETYEGKCLICSSNYRVQNGKCVRPVADRCNSCAQGYFVGQDGRCYKQIVGCSKYSSNGLCGLCNQPFLLDRGICVIPGCDKVDETGCKICSYPFKNLNNGRCGIEYCDDNNYALSICNRCVNGYHLAQGKCVINDKLCARYSKQDSSEVCVQCISDDYVLAASGICEIRRPGCVYQYGKCISCAYPFKQVGSDCVIDGCDIYSYDGCLKCIRPYTESKGFCTIANCEEIKDKRCIRCRSGFHITSSGACEENDRNCIAYQGSKCSKCASGFTLSADGTCIVEIPHCKKQSYNKCEECEYGFTLSSNGCQQTDIRCVKFGPNGCLACKDGYRTSNGVCVVGDSFCSRYSGEGYNQNCLECVKGYIFSAAGNSCVQKRPGCSYDKDGKCSSCIRPFQYSNGQCYITGCEQYSEIGCFTCTYPFEKRGDSCEIAFCNKYNSKNCDECQSGYKLIQGKCYREDPKCVNYDQSGKCTTCINGCVIFEGLCIKEDKFCINYSKNGGCNKCKDGYYVSNDGVCLPVEPGCIYVKGECTYCEHPFEYNHDARKCRIEGCIETSGKGCTKCRSPFQINSNGYCEIPHCVTVKDNACTRCTPGYHIKEGLYCVKDDPSCLRYNEDGDCEVCDSGYMLMSSGQCEKAEDNCIKSAEYGKCLACKDKYFLNRFFQCELKDPNCEEYNNGVCVQCTRRFFLYEFICFPYSPGCVSYNGKDCIKCKKNYELRAAECFKLKKPLLKLEGEDDKYDFEITPIDITKSKYNIDNLSPFSKLGTVFYSSFYNTSYTDCRLVSQDSSEYGKGWRAENKRDGEYIGYIISEGEPVTFYAIQLEGFDGFYITSFYLEYSVDGVNYIRIDKSFNSEASGKDLTTIYFTGVYAKAIRLVVRSFAGWPATRLEFFYYDYLRFRKISNLKSLRYLKESIQSNFVDRIDNQLYINNYYFFTPNTSCINKDVCFTGLELCQPRTISQLTVDCTGGKVSEIYVTYSIDGVNFNCFEKCRHIGLVDIPATVQMSGLLAKNVRVYPVTWSQTPKMSISYDYS